MNEEGLSPLVEVHSGKVEVEEQLAELAPVEPAQSLYTCSSADSCFLLAFLLSWSDASCWDCV